MINNKNEIHVSKTYIEETNHWLNTEFNSSDLADLRLNKRLLTIIGSFCASPSTSIPQASGTWGKTKATYRFLNNQKVTHENILQPHKNLTQTRISKEQVVLAIQDTTSLNYTSHSETEGLGTIGPSQNQKGMLVHTTLAVTTCRIPLGIVHQQTWVRPYEEYGKKYTRHDKPIQDKESQKWINSLLATQKLQKISPDTLLINIGDREADIYELFQLALTSDTQCKLLIRATCDRNIEHTQKNLWGHMQSQPVVETLEITVPRKNKKPERIAKVEIRFAKVSLNPPKQKSSFSPVQLWAIYANEPLPPADEDGLSWMLLTTLEVSTKEDAIQCVQYYTARFSIEIFHKILKSGCNIEKHQLKTADRLKSCLAIDSIVAWRIMFLTMLGRALPDLPCTVLLKDHEWKSLYCFVHKTQQPPEEPLSLSTAIRLIAQLGGFLARKQDGPPGAQVLWRGMKELTIISAAWISFGPRVS